MFKCVKVYKRHAEEVLKVLRDFNLLAKGVKVKRVDDYVLIPVVDEVSEDELKDVLNNFNFAICEDSFEKTTFKLSFKDILKDSIPPEVLDMIPNSYDIIGDIAIIRLPSEALSYGPLIGEAISKVAKNVKVVYASGFTEGPFRVKPLKHLFGEERSKTIHREYGIRMWVDVAKTYFNPSLAEEHKRIADFVKDGEVVGDLFCGVGSFTLHIVTRKKATVISVDLNPEAVKCLIDSLSLNFKNIIGVAIPMLADVGFALEVFKDNFFDRVIMNLPHEAFKYVPKAIEKVKCGGVLHVYSVARNPEEAVKQALENLTIEKVQVLSSSEVLEYAPRKYIYRVDLIKYCFNSSN